MVPLDQKPGSTWVSFIRHQPFQNKQTNKKEDNLAGSVTADIATANEQYSFEIRYSLEAAELPK